MLVAVYASGTVEMWKIKSSSELWLIRRDIMSRIQHCKSISFSLDSRFFALSGYVSFVLKLDIDRRIIDDHFVYTTNLRYSPWSMTHASVLRNRIYIYDAYFEDGASAAPLTTFQLPSQETIHDLCYCHPERLAASTNDQIIMLDVSSRDTIKYLFAVRCTPGVRSMTHLGGDIIVLDRQAPFLERDQLAIQTLSSQDGAIKTLESWNTKEREIDLLGVSHNGLWLIIQGGRKPGTYQFDTVFKLRHARALEGGALWNRIRYLQATRMGFEVVTSEEAHQK